MSADEVIATEHARARAHEMFDLLWQEGHMTRADAYRRRW